MAKAKVNKKVVKNVHTKVKKELALLEQYMNQLVEDVENLNEAWYGDKPANKWYAKMQAHYGSGVNKKNQQVNLVQFHKGVKNFQDKLEDVFKKNSADDIIF